MMLNNEKNYGRALVSESMKKVYVVLSGSNIGGIKKIVGIFSNQDRAKNAALKEPSYCHYGWSPSLGWKDRWDNGAGYYVMVTEYDVEQ